MLISSAQIVVFAFSALASLIWLLLRKGTPARARYRGAIFLCVSIHSMIFTVFGYFRLLSPADLNIWSATVRAHGVLGLSILGICEWIERRR